MSKALNVIYAVVMVAMIGVSAYAIIYSQIQNANFLQTYDPEEDSFWGVVKDDVAIYGIYEETYTPDRLFDEKGYMLLKNQILSVDDQGLDIDTLQDILVASHFLVGNEKIGVSVSQFLDINLLALIFNIVGMNLNLTTMEDLFIPSMSSLHITSSDFIRILDSLSNIFKDLDVEIPSFSFEYANLNTTYNNTYWRNIAEIPNTIKVEQMPTIRNQSKGLEFQVLDNSLPCEIHTQNYQKSGFEGNTSFKLYLNNSESFFEFKQIDFLGSDYASNGIILGFNGTGIYQMQGSKIWFDNGIIQTWIANVDQGKWLKVCDLEDNKWNNINVYYNNSYNQSLVVRVNGVPHLANYTIEDASYEFQVNKVAFTLNGTEPSRTYLDDIGLFFKANSDPSGNNALVESVQSFLLYDFPIAQFINSLSIYNAMFFPKVFNYDAFYDFLLACLRVVDRFIAQYIPSMPIKFEDKFKECFLNEQNSFSIQMNSTLIENLVKFLQEDMNMEQIKGLQIHFVEGHADWEIKSTWDKQIGMMNDTHFKIDYLDLNVSREIGMKLICTRSPNGFQDGYYYYNQTWFTENYTTINRPYARLISELNNDIYPNQIPSEWDLFDPALISEAFLEEFDYQPMILDYMKENVPTLLLASGGVIGASSGLSFLIVKIIASIKKDDD